MRTSRIQSLNFLLCNSDDQNIYSRHGDCITKKGRETQNIVTIALLIKANELWSTLDLSYTSTAATWQGCRQQRSSHFPEQHACPVHRGRWNLFLHDGFNMNKSISFLGPEVLTEWISMNSSNLWQQLLKTNQNKLQIPENGPQLQVQISESGIQVKHIR